MIDQKETPETERRLNRALEALHFGFRAITARPDRRLEALGYSRVHHRILYFVGRNPGCSINELLGIMRVSKQYLNRPLRQLVEDGYIQARQTGQARSTGQAPPTHSQGMPARRATHRRAEGPVGRSV